MIYAALTRSELLVADAAFICGELRRQPARWGSLGAAVDAILALDLPRVARATDGYRGDLLSLVGIGLCDPLTAEDRAAIALEA